MKQGFIKVVSDAYKLPGKIIHKGSKRDCTAPKAPGKNSLPHKRGNEFFTCPLIPKGAATQTKNKLFCAAPPNPSSSSH